jgi:hypothetical protein
MLAFPETSYGFRRRIMQVAAKPDFQRQQITFSRELDALGRKYGRFQYGVPLKVIKKPDC